MCAKLNAPVYLLGVGCTSFGNLLETPDIKDLSPYELAAKAVAEALEDANTHPDEIDMFIVGNHMPQSLNMGSLYSQLSKWIGTDLKSGVQIGAACSTTNVGASMAAAQIASGACKKVLVVGLEITQSTQKGISPYERIPTPTDDMWMWTDYGVNQAYSVPQGYDIFPVYNGLVGQGYARKYGYSIEEYDKSMMELCRTRRLHGSLTPKAFIQQTLEDEGKQLGFDDVEEFWKSRYNPHIGWPTRVRSLVTAADGASAMVLSDAEGAENYSGMPIELKGSGITINDLPWYEEDTTDWVGDKLAFEKAYEMSEISPNQIEYLHTHDCSHISGIISAETSGYLPRGEGLRLAAAGELRFDGKYPMSTHGGRHAFGHAWAASAGSDTYEAVKQMRGQAEGRQIKKPPEIAVVHTHGYASVSTVLVLKGGL